MGPVKIIHDLKIFNIFVNREVPHFIILKNLLRFFEFLVFNTKYEKGFKFRILVLLVVWTLRISYLCISLACGTSLLFTKTYIKYK